MSLGCAGGEQIFSCTSCFDIRYNVIMTPGKDGNAEAQAVLQWMEQAVGSRLLEYLVASTAEELPGLVAGDSTPLLSRSKSWLRSGRCRQLFPMSSTTRVPSMW